MTQPAGWWRRDKEGTGIWPHRGKVAITGWGQSPVDRRWDGVSMDKTLGAYAMYAAKMALDDAGLKPEDVDGLICCPDSMAGATGGSSAVWAPRPYFEAPYDSEDGLTIVTGGWLQKNMPGLTNLKYNPEQVPAIGEQMGMAAQAVAEGLCQVALVVYTAGNLQGRYRMGGENAGDTVSGNAQWTSVYGQAGLGYTTTGVMQEYCQKYGTTWDDVLAPVVVNEHINGLMHEWSYYTLHEPYALTIEDYKASRFVTYPMRLFDNDRPVNAVGAFIFTTAERAKDMKQKPVYVLNHTGGGGGPLRSSAPTLVEMESWVDRAARMGYEGSGLKPSDVDIFNPYDGYSPFLPISLESFQWKGAKKGDAKDFFNGDITVHGPFPHCSGGGNLGVGRTRTAMYIDGIEQLRGMAGERQVTTRAETAICAFAPGGSAAYLYLSNDITS